MPPKTNSWYFAVLIVACAAFWGCAHSRSKIQRDDSVDFASFHSIGVPSFTDPKGQGTPIAQAINQGLQKLMYEPVNRKTLEQILLEHKPSKDSGYDLETLEIIRRKTSADAVLIGHMAPDWSAAFIMMFETQMGEQVLRGVIRPQGKQKVFKNPNEIAIAVLKAITEP